jgi:hypothetical protein
VLAAAHVYADVPDGTNRRQWPRAGSLQLQVSVQFETRQERDINLQVSLRTEQLRVEVGKGRHLGVRHLQMRAGLSPVGEPRVLELAPKALAQRDFAGQDHLLAFHEQPAIRQAGASAIQPQIQP